MKRGDIRGFTLRFGHVWLEFVTYRHILCCIALSRNNGRRDIGQLDLWHPEF
jgi:hypothetical protein